MIKTYSRRKLGVRSAHRRALLRGLATSLIHYEKITTTEAKAKELKSYVDRMISRLKKLELSFQRNREINRWLLVNGLAVEKKLSAVVLPRYSVRQGGYVRIVHLPSRRSDRASLARVELVT